MSEYFYGHSVYYIVEARRRYALFTDLYCVQRYIMLYTFQPGDDVCPYLRNKHALPREFLSIQHLSALCLGPDLQNTLR